MPETPTTAELPWLNGWPRTSIDTVFIAGGTHCVGCGELRGMTTFVMSDEWDPPREQPAWPFKRDYCPVCAGKERYDGASPVFDVRVSDLQRGQMLLLDGAWVRVVNVVVRHPDDRVAITYEQDGEQFTTREHRGTERAAVR